MEKVIRDGKVAVLISPGFGAGWSTWAHEPKYKEPLLFHPALVAAVESGEKDPSAVLASMGLDPEDVYQGGWDGIGIVWLPEGTQFIVREYDGSETIQTLEGTQWIIA